MNRMTVRLPDNLKKWLEKSAKESGVSMNAELIKSLQSVMKKSDRSGQVSRGSAA